MKNSRREFIKAGAIGAALATTGLPAAGQATETGKVAKRPLSILILGGTGFIGPHMVREALRRGHSVTLFNRGRTNNTLFPDLETIKGDRDNGLAGLQGRKWDAVVDNSGYVPRHVADSAHLLAPNVGRYIFISSVSVYADFDVVNNEKSPLATIPDETIEEVTGETYGALKALCEQRAADEIEGEKLAILRPTYICGPGDHTDRFTYWPLRARRGGRMLWPGTPDDIVQIIDVRDLATFTIDCIDREIPGTYNLVNPRGASTMGTLLRDCQAITARGGEPVWVEEAFLSSHGVHGGTDLPIWFNSSRSIGFSADRGLGAGMHNRPVRETARDLLTWWDSLPRQRTAKPRAGLSPMKEAEVLAAWRKRG
ncbi:MAG: NAD-dependent epimerase/dehydratase family protein [Gammaproteobacteria bacterium]|nr:NAD-dependent epimerase/dehydratase family protein [Gammaproteobacteria bacterium]